MGSLRYENALINEPSQMQVGRLPRDPRTLGDFG